ncbi:MAG: DedA family protein [Firmicutes bacterium]|nr:DedA family protein [Bacillota bacterium]
MESIARWTLELFLPLGGIGLFLVSFAESSFFPIPPEVLLLPLSLVHPKKALLYGSVVTVASVLGGIFGYYIGKKGGRPLILKITTPAKLAQVEKLFRQYEAWAIGFAALTPLPYKVFTIGAGIFEIDLRKFILASCIGRGARFLTEGLLISLYGPEIATFIQGNFELVTIGIMFVVGLILIISKR